MTARPALGGAFWKLWTAASFSNLADGLGRTAVPLIATTLTRDPFVIAALGAVAFLPWLVFGIPAGLIVDRFDRRRIMALANLIRGGVALVLALITVLGVLDIWALLIATLVFGIGETLFDNATNAIVPAVVTKPALDRANGFVQGAQITVDSFIATPIAGVLFSVSLALPLWAGAVGFLVPVVLAVFLPLTAARPLQDERDGDGSTPVRIGLAAGFSYLWRNRYLRSMTLFTTVIGCALTFSQAATLLYFLDVRGVQPAAIGFVTAGIGLGALCGSLIASALVARFGRGAVMFAANLVAAAGQVALWLAPELITALVAYGLLAAAISVWNVPWGALRQSMIPNRLYGRVLGIIRSATWGVFPLASLAGGLVARIDLTLPFAIGGAVCLIATLVCTRLVLAASRHTETVELP